MISGKFISTCSHSVCGASGKGQRLFIVIPSQEWENSEMLIWRVIAKYWRKVKELGSSPSYREKTKHQGQLIALEADIHKGVLLT